MLRFGSFIALASAAFLGWHLDIVFVSGDSYSRSEMVTRLLAECAFIFLIMAMLLVMKVCWNILHHSSGNIFPAIIAAIATGVLIYLLWFTFNPFASATSNKMTPTAIELTGRSRMIEWWHFFQGAYSCFLLPLIALAVSFARTREAHAKLFLRAMGAMLAFACMQGCLAAWKCSILTPDSIWPLAIATFLNFLMFALMLVLAIFGLTYRGFQKKRGASCSCVSSVQ